MNTKEFLGEPSSFNDGVGYKQKMKCPVNVSKCHQLQALDLKKIDFDVLHSYQDHPVGEISYHWKSISRAYDFINANP